MNLALLTLRLQKLLWLLRRPRWWPLIKSGTGPSIEHAQVLAGRRYVSVIDIGANVGQFALWAQEALGAQYITCIEPQPAAVRRIAEIAARSSISIQVVEAALGAGAETRSLYVTAADDSS